LLVWISDRLFQLATGVNLLGRETVDQGRLTGMLPGVEFGLVLAVLSPVCFHAMRDYGRKVPLLWLILVPYLVMILYSGVRVSWVLLIISVVLYTALLVAVNGTFNWRRIALNLFLVISVCGVAVYQTGWLKERFVKITGLASGGEYETINASLSNRLPHWEAAIQMYRENPINGIGVKSYKDSYARYSNGDKTPRSQPHLFVLEVAAGTGSIGLIGYGAFSLS